MNELILRKAPIVPKSFGALFYRPGNFSDGRARISTWFNPSRGNAVNFGAVMYKEIINMFLQMN